MFSNRIPGKSIIVSAPSGAGKTTIVHALLDVIPQLSFSVSACSRDPRKHETNGIDYYFIGIDSFKNKIQEGAFLEWEEVYANSFYGTLRVEIDRIWDEGKVVIFDVDVEGALHLKTIFKENALSLFIMPPDVSVLEKRLRDRNTESEEKIIQRISKATWEIEKSHLFDKVIINENLEIAISEAKESVITFLNS